MDTPSPSSSSSFQVDLLPHEWSGLLYEVTRHFASSLELDEVLGKVLSLTIQAVGASEGSIFLLMRMGRLIAVSSHVPIYRQLLIMIQFRQL